MEKRNQFLKYVASEFAEDRLTFQNGIATFHPETSEEAARLFAQATKEKQPLFIAGFGNNIDPAGASFGNMLVVRTDRMSRLVKVAADDFYIIVGAGYPLQRLNQVLNEKGLFLPHADLPYAGSTGGALAIGLAARHNGHILPVGRYLIMAEIVTPRGEVIRPGSVCFKSVSGFDIVKIYSPSWGLLGLIFSATFRVLPISLAPEYGDLIMQEIDYRRFGDIYRNPGNNVSARYSLKIKEKFDPAGILPLMPL